MGDYLILGRLAIGGMADVWLARAASHPTGLVAIKTIRPELARNKRVVELFVREAAIGTRLRHPRIAHISDFGLVDGVWFIAMDYLAGATLRQLILRHEEHGRRLPLWYVLGVVTRVCAALEYLHDLKDDNLQGLLHNDVSPENIMVTVDGGVKLIDLGAAAPSGVPPPDRAYVAKMSYLPPELVLGGGLDRRSDIYSLGVILYELTVGLKPFVGDERTIVPLIAFGNYHDPRAVNPELSAPLAAVIRKAMARNPTERYPSARLLAADLRSVIDEDQVAADRDLGNYTLDMFPDRDLRAPHASFAPSQHLAFL